MQVSDAGRTKIKQREGEILHPYVDTRGFPTIGVGLRYYPDGRMVSLTDPPLTREQSDQMFKAVLARFASQVEALLTRTPSQNQFDAMVSFAFNVGIGAFGKSSVLAKFNAGDIAGAGAAFDLWHKPAEIIERRNSEREQFLASPPVQTPNPSPAPAQPPAKGIVGPWEALWNFIMALFGRKA